MRGSIVMVLAACTGGEGTPTIPTATEPYEPLPTTPPTVLQDVPVLLEGAPFCAANPEFSPDQNWVYTMELSDPRAPIPRFDVVVRPFDRDQGTLWTTSSGTTPSARLSASLYGRPYFAQDDVGPYLVGDAVSDAAGEPMRTLTRWRPRLVDDSVVLDATALMPTEPDHDPSVDPTDPAWVPCRRSVFPYSEPGGDAYVWWFDSEHCASNQTDWVELWRLPLDEFDAAPVRVERQAWDPACKATPACFLEWKGNLPMDISYSRWVLGASKARLLFGSVDTPDAYGAVGADYGDSAGGGPIELLELDPATGATQWVTHDGALKVAPFAVTPQRFVSGIDGSDTARSYAWSVDRYVPLHEILPDPTTSGLYDPAPTDEWPAAPEGAASAEAVLVRGVAEYAAFQLSLGGTFAWVGLPGEIWLGSASTGTPVPISDADRGTARNEPEPVLSSDQRVLHVAYSAWDVSRPALACQEMRVVSVDFSCATLDVPPVVDTAVGPAAGAGAGGSEWLAMGPDTMVAVGFDLTELVDVPRAAELVLTAESAEPLPALYRCAPFVETAEELECEPVDVRGAEQSDGWVIDVTALVRDEVGGRLHLAVDGPATRVRSKESGVAPQLQLAFDDCGA